MNTLFTEARKGGMNMVRFRVIKAAHLAVALAAVLLLAVIVALAIRYVTSANDAVPTGSYASGALEAGDSVARMQIELVPEVALIGATAAPMENEHTDAEADAVTAVSAVPSVLIYHTHTHEAYQQVADDPYEEVGGRWRTTDNAHNVVRVGDELTQALIERGISVTHNTTDHEQDDFETAYARSLETLESYEQSFDLYIDLHRDAYGTEPEEAVTVTVGQQRMAKLMCLVGTGDGFDVRPDSAANYEFALELTDRINEAAPGLCRDVLVKSKRYNQHVGRCLLLEVGHNLNTLEEALDTIPYLADALAGMLKGEESIAGFVALAGKQ